LTRFIFGQLFAHFWTWRKRNKRSDDKNPEIRHVSDAARAVLFTLIEKNREILRHEKCFNN